jgi:hypothetical protein
MKTAIEIIQTTIVITKTPIISLLLLPSLFMSDAPSCVFMASITERKLRRFPATADGYGFGLCKFDEIRAFAKTLAIVRAVAIRRCFRKAASAIFP